MVTCSSRRRHRSSGFVGSNRTPARTAMATDVFGHADARHGNVATRGVARFHHAPPGVRSFLSDGADADAERANSARPGHGVGGQGGPGRDGLDWPRLPWRATEDMLTMTPGGTVARPSWRRPAHHEGGAGEVDAEHRIPPLQTELDDGTGAAVLLTSSPSRRMPALLMRPFSPPIAACAQLTKLAHRPSSAT